ncbi:MAG: glycosyl hydrolase, partial [Kiritimatiellales bacterium]
APGKEHGRWLDDPYALKASGDLAFSLGINRYIFHRYALQPWTTRVPGMTMGQWGTHFDRTCTWWEQGSEWMKYIARSQFMLQQGLFAADAAAFCGESAPVQMPVINPELPAGYDYDGINADVLLNLASVKDGVLTLKSGMRYHVLSLFPQNRTMTPELLRRLRDFVADGLTLVGPPPEKSPSLAGYPKCDAEVKSLTAEMWGDCDGKTVTEHQLGKGKVVWGQTMAQVFASLKVPPDFSFTTNNSSQLVYIHRLDGDADIYFVANQRDQADSADCTFRVSGKAPELWHPDTGRIEPAPVWREEGGRITVPLQFDPAGSVFVVFRKPAGAGDHVVSATFSAQSRSADSPSELKIQKARYESADDERGVDVTGLLNDQIRDGRLKIKVINKTLGGDPVLNHRKQLRVEYVLNGQSGEKIVPENQDMELDGSVADIEQPLELISSVTGQVKLRASAPGSAELKMASGRTVKMEVRGVPKPVELSGPWELNFPPDRGAPEQVSLPQLISWTEYADSGVKYFSGTAVYVKEVEIPAKMFGDGYVLWLDLGRVKNIAEVSVNGKPPGILWKPPFRANITAAAKPGRNKLEIKITNLWPNRLIGDEQLPPDCEWGNNLSLTKWPQWLLDGKPSPTGRFTFTTWHHWKKDDALLPSGLLGPVTLSAAEEVAVNPEQK